MGLTAHLFKSKRTMDAILLNPEKGDTNLAYFRNNWELQRFLNKCCYSAKNGGLEVAFLDHERLEGMKHLAEEYDDFNKDYGEGVSVLSIINEAIEAEHEGYNVYYTASY